jgi:hypothetical protein
MQMADERATSLYGLADSAYGAGQIERYSRSLRQVRRDARPMGHVPIIAGKRRNGRDPVMDPAAARFRERTTAERAFSSLKDGHGGRFVGVRGAAKVMARLMFGVVAPTAARLFALLE